jgi:hypothetical protein
MELALREAGGRVSSIEGRVYENAFAVTTSDATADANGPFAGLIVSVAGTLKVTTVGGTTVAFTVIAGQEIHLAVQRVWTTGTTATVIGLSQSPYKAPLNPGTGVVL